MAIENPTKYVTVRRLNRFKQKLSTDELLHPVNINTLTPSSTFVKNAVVGINGVLYRSTASTSNLPCTLVVQDGAFVVNVVNGKKAFVVSNGAPNQDWEIWTDAAIEYWIEQLTASINQKATVSDVLAATVPNTTFTVQQLLQTVATLMPQTVVVSD